MYLIKLGAFWSQGSPCIFQHLQAWCLSLSRCSTGACWRNSKLIKNGRWFWFYKDVMKLWFMPKTWSALAFILGCAILMSTWKGSTSGHIKIKSHLYSIFLNCWGLKKNSVKDIHMPKMQVQGIWLMWKNLLSIEIALFPKLFLWFWWERDDTRSEWKPKQILLLPVFTLFRIWRKACFSHLLCSNTTLLKGIKHWKLGLEE